MFAHAKTKQDERDIKAHEPIEIHRDLAFPIFDSREVMSETEKETPPEGGLQGWLVVVGAFLALFGSFGFLNAYGI